MRRPKTLPAFTSDEREKAHELLALQVAYMMGRKMEEAHWAEVYCRAKNIPLKGWSNLNLDIMHNGLGIEHKMLCKKSRTDLGELFGRTEMHPSATRSIRVPPTTTPAEEAMRDILKQYADFIEARRKIVSTTATGGAEPDMRIGWLLWQSSLRQFLYFEEEMLSPDPNDYTAEWTKDKDSTEGARKQSKNLWIFEKETGRKRYSVTTTAGAKIQPYFDIPPPSDPNVYLFTVIGESVLIGTQNLIRVWVTEGTARELTRILKAIDTDTISRAIIETANEIADEDIIEEANIQVGQSILITVEAYQALHRALPGVSDEYSLQRFAQCLRRSVESGV